MIVVVAGNYAEYLHYLKSERLAKSECRYLGQPTDVLGLDPTEVELRFVGTWTHNPLSRSPHLAELERRIRVYRDNIAAYGKTPEHDFFLAKVREAAEDPDCTFNRMVAETSSGRLSVEPRAWTGNFNVGDYTDAIKRQRKLSDMRRFYVGNMHWHMSAGVAEDEARHKVRSCIGAVFNDLGYWRRFKWWLATGARWSDTMYA